MALGVGFTSFPDGIVDLGGSHWATGHNGVLCYLRYVRKDRALVWMKQVVANELDVIL